MVRPRMNSTAHGNGERTRKSASSLSSGCGSPRIIPSPPPDHFGTFPHHFGVMFPAPDLDKMKAGNRSEDGRTLATGAESLMPTGFGRLWNKSDDRQTRILAAIWTRSMNGVYERGLWTGCIDPVHIITRRRVKERRQQGGNPCDDCIWTRLEQVGQPPRQDFGLRYGLGL